MPWVNWREVADNWFGNCFCSFSGISEKVVMKYVNSYTCAPGICLLSSTSVTLCKDDLVECNFAEGSGEREYSSIAENPRDDGVGKGARNCELNGERTSTCTDDGGVGPKCEEKECRIGENPREDGVGKDTRNYDGGLTLAFDNYSRIVHPEDEKLSVNLKTPVHIEILGNQKSFINGSLEDVFMARLSNHSKDIEWREFRCPQCTSLLGAHPCCEGNIPVDRGV